MNTHGPDAHGGLMIAAFVVVGVAVVGLLAGTRESGYAPQVPSARKRAASADEGEGGARPARSYSELMTRPWGEEPLRDGAVRRALHAPGRTRIPASDGEAKAAALAARESRRAFAGAPPSIPHPIGQGNGRECPTCHLEGGMLGATLAPPWSHASFAQCSQCHVPEHTQVPVSEHTFLVASSFEPLRGAPAPSRWSEAPPQLPHTSWMREKCESCHGDYGRHGLQTTHPERQSCTQCHAPAAIVEQMPHTAQVPQ